MLRKGGKHQRLAKQFDPQHPYLEALATDYHLLTLRDWINCAADFARQMKFENEWISLVVKRKAIRDLLEPDMSEYGLTGTPGTEIYVNARKAARWGRIWRPKKLAGRLITAVMSRFVANPTVAEIELMDGQYAGRTTWFKFEHLTRLSPLEALAMAADD